MPRRIPPLSNNDLDNFHSFPPNIQRKCFSSLERLRIAQGTSISRRKPASSHGIAKSLHTTPRSRPSLVRRNSSYFKNSSFRRRKSCSPTNDTFSNSDAQWFQRLPSKVQRRHFTEEEQNFLSGLHSSPVIPDAADLRLYERYLDLNRSVPTLYSTTSGSRSRRSSISTFGATDDMDDTMMDTFHFFDSDAELDLASTLDDYHRFYAPEATKQQKSNYHPSFRKVMSLSSLPSVSSPLPPPLPAKVSATASPTPQQATTPTTSAFSTHTRNCSRPQTHNQPSPSSTIEPPACHYQDPSTRLKLRVYLSPSKFDEAIEFGFPSIEDADLQPLARPSLSSQRRRKTAPSSNHASEVAGKTFLDDSNLSVFDALSASSSSSDEDEIQSLPERNSPDTPLDLDFEDTYLLSPSVTSQPSPPLPPSPHRRDPLSMHPISKPTIRHDASNPLAQVIAGSREMTLRMTLTRPDLRAGEKELHRRMSGGDDPLALEQLPVTSEKGADIWKMMPSAKETGLRRIWRKVSGRRP